LFHKIKKKIKKYAIVLDENGDVRVIPNKWLIDNKSAMFWPSLKQKSDINDAVIHLRDVSKNWSKYSITKYIKSNSMILKNTIKIFNERSSIKI